MAVRRVRVLLVEDDEDDFLLTREWLEEIEGTEYALDWTADYDAGLAEIARRRHDVYLVDYRLAGSCGLDLVRVAVAAGCAAPLILLTGQGDRAVDVEAMALGAADFLIKGRIDAALLERSIRYAIERKRTEDSLRQARAELEGRVAERTAELARANAELRRRVAELDEARNVAEAASLAKDQFLAMLSHELRTPLTPVLMAAAALNDDPDTPEHLRPTFAMIRQNVELEARLIDDLLDVMRIIRGKLPYQFEPVDLHDLIGRTLEICRSEARAKCLLLDVDLAAAEPFVRGDPARLQQVLWNLVKNAIKFTPEGGRIGVRSAARDGWAAIEVSDSGIGIDPAVLPKVFNAFEQGEDSITRRFGGLGLGLAISRSIAEAHGGRLAAASAGPGLGATFTLELATISPAAFRAGRAAAPRPDDGPRSANLRLLLVEDDPMTARVMGKLLRNAGYAVTTANSVADALAAPLGEIDVIISDLGLPDGSGLDVMRRARDLAGRALPGIALTGFGMDEDHRKTREAGFVAHLTKPIDFPRLDAMIQQVGARD